MSCQQRTKAPPPHLIMCQSHDTNQYIAHARDYNLFEVCHMAHGLSLLLPQQGDQCCYEGYISVKV